MIREWICKIDVDQSFMVKITFEGVRNSIFLDFLWWIGKNCTYYKQQN